jgi:hypothetical protein
MYPGGLGGVPCVVMAWLFRTGLRLQSEARRHKRLTRGAPNAEPVCVPVSFICSRWVSVVGHGP